LLLLSSACGVSRTFISDTATAAAAAADAALTFRTVAENDSEGVTVAAVCVLVAFNDDRTVVFALSEDSSFFSSNGSCEAETFDRSGVVKSSAIVAAVAAVVAVPTMMMTYDLLLLSCSKDEGEERTRKNIGEGGTGMSREIFTTIATCDREGMDHR
jgi:hypothetical protein